MPALPLKMITQRETFNASHHTELNHLGALMLLEPHKMTAVTDHLFATQNMFNDNALSSTMYNMGEEVTIDQTDWTWEKTGETGRPFVILEDFPANAGLGRQPFDGFIDEKTLVFGDILSFGEFNRKWQIRVISDGPRLRGAGAVYTFELASTDNPRVSLPAELGVKGGKVLKEFSLYGEGAEKSGSMQHYEEKFQLYNRLSRLRKHYQVTGDVVNQVLAIKVGTVDGKGSVTGSFTTWVRFKEALFMKQWNDEVARVQLFSRANSTMKDSTGRLLLPGAGLHEQLEMGHRYVYSKLSKSLFNDFIGDLHFSRVKPGTKMNLQAFTGREGLNAFSQAIEEGLLANQIAQTFNSSTGFSTIQKTNSQFHDNAYMVGHQFTGYMLNNGVTLTVNYEPAYDDKNRNTIMDPETGRPLSSSRFTILDFTGKDGQGSNIKKVRLRGGFGQAYVCGMVTPTGRRKSGEAAHEGDYYSMHCQDQVGCQIDDVTKTGELIKA